MGQLMSLGGVYHLTDHAVNKNNVFVVADNYWYFLSRYAHFTPQVCDTYAYCQMPNHFHIAVKVKTRAALLLSPPQLLDNWKLSKSSTDKDFQNRVSKQFANLFSSYTQSLNKQQGREGALFKGNFCRSKVEDRAYFHNMILYIHCNAVHHEFCTHYMEWAHSSIHTLLFEEDAGFLKRDILFDSFGGRDAFIKAHDAWRLSDWDEDFS